MSERDHPSRPFIAREGWGYVSGLSAIGFISILFGGWIWATLFFLLAAAVAGFFRDPHRTPPDEPGIVLSPADGRVVEIAPTEDAGKVVRIFLSPLDVHINRSPVDGRISSIHYQKGRFLAAYKEAASSNNEQNALEIETNTGDNFRVVQIAGVLARRIVCWTKAGDTISAGERFGLIQFGSRTDLYFPEGYDISVEKGQRVRGGETIVGRAIHQTTTE
ncbi:MAG: phosphatidylserine decarboxylase family protein [Nitrospinae bacterium]|nr:phosphatidylserine decarboxylase family protein [Nitrospinota bacterium]